MNYEINAIFEVGKHQKLSIKKEPITMNFNNIEQLRFSIMNLEVLLIHLLW